MLHLLFSAAEAIVPSAEQTASAPPSLFVTIIGSAFIGALVTSGVTIWTKFADTKKEHRAWLKQAKLETYTEFGKLAFRCLEEVSTQGKQSTASLTKSELVGLHSRMLLLSNRTITDEALAVQVGIKNLVSSYVNNRGDITSSRKDVSNSLERLLRNMQNDLDIKIDVDRARA